MLTAAMLAKMKPKEKDVTLPDTDHLYLRLRTTGAMSWIVRYMVDGHAKVKTIGSYPAMGLAEARRARDDVMQSVANGDTDPGNKNVTVADITSEWIQRRTGHVSERYRANCQQRLDAYVLPVIGKTVASKVTRQQLVKIVVNLFDSGREETARRTAGHLENIFAYALNTGAISNSPAQYLTTALPDKTKKVQHFRSTSDHEEIRAMMQGLSMIDSFQTRHALQIIAYTAVRVGELLRAHRDEIDLKHAVWIVPEEHMKKRKELVVPLSRQVVVLLKEVLAFNADVRPKSKLLFPALNPRSDGDTSLTEAALLKALKVLCWQHPGTPAMTIHGFRSMASSVLNEHGWNPDAIERQLAHVPQGVRGIYNRAEYLDIRTEMMQWYSDYLDALRDGRPTPNVSKNATLMRL